jgi:UDP-glucose 4-epimerase
VSNPYGRSKWMVEQVLQDLAATDPRWAFAVLRYFNPVGAHPSGMLGEDPKGIPNNLVPYVAQVAVGRLQSLQVYGSDYPTPDGTGVRDYIHVQDLVAGHLAALGFLAAHTGWHVWNLGTGKGHSVLEVVQAFERASGRSISINRVDRRDGDVAESWADVQKADRELGWRAELGLTQMMEDHWRWQAMNPMGYVA